MYSLVKFIGLAPFDDKKLWNYWIGLKKLSKTEHSATRFNIIGKALILRRTKEEVKGRGGPDIPPKTVIDIELELSGEEQEVYDHIEAYAK
jgi:SNF2 family DNA or RNA helicase